MQNKIIQGKVALVKGGSRGSDRHRPRLAARRRVSCRSLTQVQQEKALQLVSESNPPEESTVPKTDSASAEELRAAAPETRKPSVRLTSFVSNAGILTRAQSTLYSRRLRPHGGHSKRPCRLRRYSGGCPTNERRRPIVLIAATPLFAHCLPWRKCLQHDQGLRLQGWFGALPSIWPARHHGKMFSPDPQRPT